jgi:hypothetical protein
VSFAAKLRTAAGRLPASACADAVSPLLSRRVVENWIAGRNEPPNWTHDMILTRITRAAKAAKLRERAAMPTSNVKMRDPAGEPRP